MLLWTQQGLLHLMMVCTGTHLLQKGMIYLPFIELNSNPLIYFIEKVHTIHVVLFCSLNMSNIFLEKQNNIQSAGFQGIYYYEAEWPKPFICCLSPSLKLSHGLKKIVEHSLPSRKLGIFNLHLRNLLCN